MLNTKLSNPLAFPVFDICFPKRSAKDVLEVTVALFVLYIFIYYLYCLIPSHRWSTMDVCTGSIWVHNKTLYFLDLHHSKQFLAKHCVWAEFYAGVFQAADWFWRKIEPESQQFSASRRILEKDLRIIGLVEIDAKLGQNWTQTTVLLVNINPLAGQKEVSSWFTIHPERVPSVSYTLRFFRRTGTAECLAITQAKS